MAVAQNANVQAGDQVAILDNNNSGAGNHLHFELYQSQNGTWYAVNPLGNDLGWNLQHPTDNNAPQINDVYIEALTNQTNNVGSGYEILQNNGSIIEHAVGGKDY